MAQTFAYAGTPQVGDALSKRLEGAGYELVTDLEKADFLFTYYSSMQLLEDAFFDAKGFMQRAKKGTYLIDFSPSTPNFARELSAVASVSDLFYVEAPLQVKDTTLIKAFDDPENLSCILAGDAPDIRVARGILEHFVGSFTETGEPGSAQLNHAAWTLQRSAQLMAAIEAEALCRAVRRIPTSAAAASTGNAIALGDAEAAVIAAVSAKRFGGAFTVEMFMADLTAALSAADDADLILPQAEACMNLVELLAIIGGSDYAPCALALIYDEEEAASEAGLDWSRAEEYTKEMSAHGQGEQGQGGRGSSDDDDFGGYADLFGDFNNN